MRKILIKRMMTSPPAHHRRGGVYKGVLQKEIPQTEILKGKALEFYQAEAFERHFERSRSGPLSSSYLLLIPDLFERKFLAQRMAHAINKNYAYVDASALLAEIESPSFFPEKRVLICEGIETLQEDHTILLPPGLILIATSGALPSPLEILSKSSIVLNLTKEKPWERTARLRRWLSEHAYSANKMIEAEALTYLLSLGHTNFFELLQELEKAIVYAGDGDRISTEMTQSTASPLLQTGWQLSEILVWGGGNLNHHSINALENLHALVGQVRYQLHLGMSLASCGKAPKPFSKKGERLKALAIRYSPSYFLVGLRELFALELKMRSNIGPYAPLFTHFYAKLSKRRSH